MIIGSKQVKKVFISFKILNFRDFFTTKYKELDLNSLN
jgi:tRNA G37 N-methylase TrmD